MKITEIEKASLDLIVNLQNELKDAPPMAGIVLLDLIKTANELNIKINDYLAAK